MRSFLYLAVGTLLSASMPAHAQLAPWPVKAAQFTKIILNPDIPATSQKVKVGTICLFSGPALNFGSTERTLANEHYERLFASTLENRGFKVVAKSTDLFEGEGNSPAADYLVGATVRPQSVDICDSVNGVKGSITLSVEWKIYDRSKQQVVETVTTQGVGHQANFLKSGIAGFFDQAFTESLVALIDQGVVQKYLGTPAPATPAKSVPAAP